MKISIIIITWNSVAVLKNCLKSLEDIFQRGDIECIIIDNGSEDDTVAFLKRTYPYIKLIELPINRGVAYARNRGLEIAKGEYLFILDNDTVVNREAIEGMEKFMDEHPDVGMCGCKLLDANNLLQESCKRYPGIGEKIANLIQAGKYRYTYGLEKMQSPFQPEYIIGACQFIRRKAFEEVGLLDEKIFFGPEDADFCLRVKKAGWKVYYLPQFTIMHLCQRATNRNIFSKLAMKHVKGAFYFYWKHKRLF